GKDETLHNALPVIGYPQERKAVGQTTDENDTDESLEHGSLTTRDAHTASHAGGNYQHGILRTNLDLTTVEPRKEYHAGEESAKGAYHIRGYLDELRVDAREA